VPCQNSYAAAELGLVVSLACSSVFADQAADGLPALDPGGDIDDVAGLALRRSLTACLVRVGAENYVTSCDLGIFVDQATEPVAPQHMDTRTFCG
jgi:hypothetical protein